MVWEPLCLFVCVCSCVGVCDSRETQIKAGDWSMWQIAAVKEKKRKRKRKKKKDLASLVKRKESMYFYFLLLLFRNFGNLSWTPESPDTQIKPSLRILHCMPEVLVNQKKLMILLILLSFLHDLHLLWFWFDSDFFFLPRFPWVGRSLGGGMRNVRSSQYCWNFPLSTVANKGDETGGMLLSESGGDAMCLWFDPERIWLGTALPIAYFKLVLICIICPL